MYSVHEMAPRQISFAIHRRPDSKGYFEVGVKGFDVAYPEKSNAWNFYVDVLRGDWDAGELAFSHYLIARDIGLPLIAVPAFQLRFLPHYGLSVHKEAGISEPADLAGKRVGAADWGINPAVWMRGILTHQYDVPTERIAWFESAAKPSFPDWDYRHSARFKHGLLHPQEAIARSQPEAYGLKAELEAHTIDAAILPGQGMGETPNTRRLFEDPLREAQAYVAATRAIPVNSVIVLRRDVAEDLPDLGPAILESAERALEVHTAEVESDPAANYTYIPVSFVREAGMFPFRQGVAANRRAIALMAAYCYEQGLTQTLYSLDDLFLGSCL